MSTVPSDLDCIIRVARAAVTQNGRTPDSERVSCRRLLEMAIPLLEQARIDADIKAIREASSREAAAAIRDGVINQAMQGKRSQDDWNAVCNAVMEKWGPVALGDYPSGVARTGD